MSSSIREFKGGYWFLSNFYPSDVMLNGELYMTVEHAYQAAKTLDIDDRFRIMEANTPAVAKRLGKKVTLRPDWLKTKRFTMRMLVRQKFEGEMLRRLLVNTYPSKLLEGNHWGDTYWGVDLKTGKGLNYLGRILMTVRREIMLKEERIQL